MLLLLAALVGTVGGTPLSAVWTFDNDAAQNLDLSGLSVDRIVGGNAVSPPNRYRFPVRLRITAGSGAAARTRVCGGALITARAVLTAAHCLADPGINKVTAIVGLHDVSTRVPPASVFAASSWIVHPNYTPGSADIGLVLLQASVSATTGKPVPLDYESVDRTPLIQNSTAPTLAALGWGATNPYDVSGSQSSTLQIVSLFFKTTRECKRIMGQTIDGDDHMCAIGSRTTFSRGASSAPVVVAADTCGGDSGGPLLLSVDPASSFEPEYAARARAAYNLGCSLCDAPFLGQLVGVVSFGSAGSDGRQCAVESAYGVYTRVAKYTPWIETELTRAGAGVPIRAVPLRTAWTQNLVAPPSQPPPAAAPPSRGGAPLPPLPLILSDVLVSSSFGIVNAGCSAVPLGGASITVGTWTSFLSGALEPGETLTVCDSALLGRIAGSCGAFAPFGAVARGTSVAVRVPGEEPWSAAVGPGAAPGMLRPAERCRR